MKIRPIEAAVAIVLLVVFLLVVTIERDADYYKNQKLRFVRNCVAEAEITVDQCLQSGDFLYDRRIRETKER